MILSTRNTIDSDLIKYPSSDILCVLNYGATKPNLKYINRAMQIEINNSDHWNKMTEYQAKNVVEFIRDKKFDTQFILFTEDNCKFKSALIQLYNLLHNQMLYQDLIVRDTTVDMETVALLDKAAKLNGKLIEMLE